jgi:hypothetical protein
MQHSSIPSSNVIYNKEDETKNKNNNMDNDVGIITSKLENTRRKIPFWSENPNVLFQSKYIMEFFPVDTMSYEQKLNAITRIVIVLTIIGISITRSIRTLMIGIITIGSIFILYYYHQKEISKKNDKKNMQKIKENFENTSPVVDDLVQLYKVSIPGPEQIFERPSSINPFSNVLVTDYDYNPNKKPAPPAFNKSINNTILEEAKRFVIEANPDQPDIADKLFNDMGDKLVFEQSLRPFSSNPSTTIPNDQTAFVDFCYGNMFGANSSCKEGNPFACARVLSRHTNI